MIMNDNDNIRLIMILTWQLIKLFIACDDKALPR